MQLTSPAFTNGQEIQQKYGNKNGNISLPLLWQGAPEGTTSFALSIVDTHPVAHNYVHWLVTGIGADTTSIPEGASGKAMPAGSQELVPYAGPFPPSGTHDYVITLYALGGELVVPPVVTLEAFTEAANRSALATATLTGTFTRI